MGEADYHTHEDTPTYEVAIVFHVHGPVNAYDISKATAAAQSHLKYDTAQQVYRNVLPIFSNAIELHPLDVDEVAATTCRCSGTSGARLPAPVPSRP